MSSIRRITHIHTAHHCHCKAFEKPQHAVCKEAAWLLQVASLERPTSTIVIGRVLTIRPL
jgi:hypothetical protein